MHVVLGDGEMPKRELVETLNDLFRQAEEAEAPLWFLLVAKPEPTATDTAMLTWLHKNQVYYEILTDDVESVPPLYMESAQEVHTVKRLSQKIVNLMGSKPDEGEEAVALALFSSDDPEDEADRWLNGTIQAVVEAGFKVYALNDGLIEVDLSEAAAEPEPEPQRPTKTPAKKVAAKAAAAPEAETDEGDAVPTREALKEMDLDQLKEVAGNMGITLPPRTRMTTYIDAILGETKGTPQAEIEDTGNGNGNGHATSSNGASANFTMETPVVGLEGVDIEDLTDRIAEETARRVLAKLAEGLVTVTSD